MFFNGKVNKVNNKFQNWLLVIRMSLESLYKSKKWAQSPELRARQIGHFDLKNGKIMNVMIFYEISKSQLQPWALAASLRDWNKWKRTENWIKKWAQALPRAHVQLPLSGVMATNVCQQIGFKIEQHEPRLSSGHGTELKSPKKNSKQMYKSFCWAYLEILEMSTKT